jgi:cell filamentation protein
LPTDLVPTDPATHAVATTIAVHRIEGWRPSACHVDALHAIARGGLSVTEYLQNSRDRHPPPQQPRKRLRLGRSTPYLLPGTQVLRNEFGVTTAEALADLEYSASAARMLCWLQAPAAPAAEALDARTLHRHLFGDSYGWAGAYRIVELRRGRTVFAPASIIDAQMDVVHSTARELVTADVDGPRLAYELARLYAQYNQIHPFREGNGRTGAVLLLEIAARCGRHLDLTGITREQWYTAAADSMPLRGGDGRVSHRPFLYLLSRALT